MAAYSDILRTQQDRIDVCNNLESVEDETLHRAYLSSYTFVIVFSVELEYSLKQIVIYYNLKTRRNLIK